MRVEFEGITLEVTDQQRLNRVLSFDVQSNNIEINPTEVTFTGRETWNKIDSFINQYSRAYPMPADLISRIGETYRCYIHFINSNKTDKSFTGRIELRGSGNHFFNIANGLTFEVLKSKGQITAVNSQLIRYQIFPNTTRSEHISILFSGVILVIQFIQASFELAKLIADFLDVLGTGVLTAIAKAIAVAIYFATALIAIIQYGIQVRNTYAPPLRKMWATDIYKLMQQAAAAIGFTFTSSTLASFSPNWQLININKFVEGRSIFKLFEYEDPDTVYNDFYPREGDSFYIVGQMFSKIASWFNLTIRVANNQIRMEPESFFATSVGVTIPEFLADQESAQDANGFNNNSKRIWQAKVLRYPEDATDIHSQDMTRNSFIEKRAEFINTYPDTPDAYIRGDQDLAGLNEEFAPYSLIKRKDELFRLEKLIVNIVLEPLDALTGIFGGGTNYASTFTNDRIGVAVIENLYFTNSRVFWNGGNGKQPANFMNFLNTNKVYNDFHIPLEPANASAAVRQMTIPFFAGNFGQIIANNFVQTQSGKTIKIVKLEYDDEWDGNSAVVQYEEPDDSMDNVRVIDVG